MLNLVIPIVEAAWSLSTYVAPLLFLIFFMVYVLERGQYSTPLAVIVSSQRDMTLTYAPYIVIGIYLGGMAMLFSEGSNLLLGSLLVALLGGYGYIKRLVPPIDTLELTNWSDYRSLFWLLVPLLSIAAVVLDHTLLKNVLALLFYATIFWEM